MAITRREFLKLVGALAAQEYIRIGPGVVEPLQLVYATGKVKTIIGRFLAIFRPRHSEFPSIDPASLSMDSLNRIALRYGDVVSESAVFTNVMPYDYDGDGCIVRIHYIMDTARTGDVRWSVAFRRIDNQHHDVDDEWIAVTQSVDATVPDSLDITDSDPIGSADIAFSAGPQMDNVSAGEMFRIRVTRAATAISDTALGHAQLLLVYVMELVSEDLHYRT